jgi:photosystem II stability/assembly factor-like uncharacterized protein
MALLFGLAGVAAAASGASGPVNLGIGGGGGLTVPSSSPYDVSLLFVASDTGNVFVSRDGGAKWRLIDNRQLYGANRCRMLYDPTEEKVMYAADGQGLKVSRDRGRTWQRLVEGEGPWKSEVITHLAVEKTGKKMMYAGTEGGLCRSDDKGKVWRRVGGFQAACSGIICLATHTYAAFGGSVFETMDGGSSWQQRRVYPGEGRIVALTGGYTRGGRMLILAAVSGVGVVGSENMGKTYSLVLKQPDVQDVIMAPEQDKIAFAASSAKVWRTDDGGGTWTECFPAAGDAEKASAAKSWVRTDLSRACKIRLNGLGVNPTGGALAMLCTDGELYMSHDAGRAWVLGMDVVAGGAAGKKGATYMSVGLEANSPWEYYVDPRKRANNYIAYSRGGFCRSADKGDTWSASTQAGLADATFYDAAFDPFVEGRMYAAVSGQPDIPDWAQLDRAGESGGVAVSDDYGKTWKAAGTGLPNKPCTSLAVDPKSIKGAVALYAAVYGDGVYKSGDSGRTWTRKSLGLGPEGNNHAFMVKVHPATGEVFCSITGARKGDEFPVAGGLWRSQDGGETWEDITSELGLRWPAGFDLDPRDSMVIYLAASSVPGKSEGGLYKTSTGGKTWTRLRRDEDFAAEGEAEGVRAWFVAVCPSSPDTIYLSTIGHGLWYSKDAGGSWARLDWVPCRSITRVSFPPLDRSSIYVSTFGAGVWKGPATPATPAAGAEPGAE